MIIIICFRYLQEMRHFVLVQMTSYDCILFAGISYMINSHTFDCKLSPLTNVSGDAIETDDHHHIRMRTTEEMFRIGTRPFVYEGVTKVRGIPVDVFSRLDHSPKPPYGKVHFYVEVFGIVNHLDEVQGVCVGYFVTCSAPPQLVVYQA